MNMSYYPYVIWITFRNHRQKRKSKQFMFFNYQDYLMAKSTYIYTFFCIQPILVSMPPRVVTVLTHSASLVC